MQYGLGHLSVVPILQVADPASMMVSQILYGDAFKIKEERKKYSRIQLAFDGFEGWVNNEQIKKITEEDYKAIATTDNAVYNSDFLTYVSSNDESGILPVLLGSRLDICQLLGHAAEEMPKLTWSKANLVDIALLYLNSPFLAGGRTPFGIDSAGFTQMVYKINGQKLLRTVEGQSGQGEALSFIEESEPGDLAFFDDPNGSIYHVGIVLEDNYIIHASGSVRIDRLDHTGIFNTEKRAYTHSLRVLKKIV